MLQLSVLFISVLIFYNFYALHLRDAFIVEKASSRALTIDMLCDLAEAGGEHQKLIDAMSKIDGSGTRGSYAVAFDKDLEELSERTYFFPNTQFNPLNDKDFLWNVEHQRRGRAVVIFGKSAEAAAHPVNMYFRWAFYDTDDPILVVVGISKYSLETDVDGWLWTGAILIGAGFSVMGVASVIRSFIRRRGKGGTER